MKWKLAHESAKFFFMSNYKRKVNRKSHTKKLSWMTLQWSNQIPPPATRSKNSTPSIPFLNRSHQTNVITSLTDQKQEVFLQSFFVFFKNNAQKKIWFWIPVLTKCSVDLQCGHLRNLAKNGKSSLTPRLFVQSKCLHAGYPDIWGSSEILTGSVKPNPRALSTQASAS